MQSDGAGAEAEGLGGVQGPSPTPHHHHHLRDGRLAPRGLTGYFPTARLSPTPSSSTEGAHW
eukprot:294714-Chlamydomonas_euryale.AAC.1